VERHAVAVIDARHARCEPACDLVVDRVDAPRELLGGDALVALLADQDDWRARLDVGFRSQVHRYVVHADGADERVSCASDKDFGVVGESAAPAVPVADRDRGDPSGGGRAPAAAVAGAVARLELADGGDVGLEVQRGLESARGGILLERVHAVDGDAAAHHVEVRRRLAEGGRAVGGVDDDVGVLGAEALGECARRRWMPILPSPSLIAPGKKSTR